jgi:hypothetical protein
VSVFDRVSLLKWVRLSACMPFGHEKNSIHA